MPKKQEKVAQDDRIEMELNFNRSLSDSDQQSEAPRASIKPKKKVRRDDDDDDVFSDDNNVGNSYANFMMLQRNLL